MSNTIKTFGVRTVKMGRSNDLPFPPHVSIVLEQWTTVGKDIPAVTAQLANEAEIDTWIGLLKADLDAAGARAKAAIRKAREETAAIVAARNSK